jgi:hypothetical protein
MKILTGCFLFLALITNSLSAQDLDSQQSQTQIQISTPTNGIQAADAEDEVPKAQIEQENVDIHNRIERAKKAGVVFKKDQRGTVEDFERRMGYIEAHPKTSHGKKQDIFDGKIRIGMTRDQVIASWDKPTHINKDVGPWGVHEQWIYEDRQYLYFENGVLTSFQGPQ